MENQQPTEIHTGGGPAVGGDATAGQNWIGGNSHKRRDSQNVVIQLEQTHNDLATLHAKIQEMAVDLKLLTAISQERTMQIERLQNRVTSIDRAMFAMAIGFAIFVWFAWR